MDENKLEKNENGVGKSEDAFICGPYPLNTAFVLGDIVWIKTNGNWWPAQVVEGSSENRSNGISGNLQGEIRVRLYGSYKHRDVDPMKYHSEFEKVLKNNNWSYRKILKKSLRRELHLLRDGNGDEIETRMSESEDDHPVKASNMKNEKEDAIKKNEKKSPSQRAKIKTSDMGNKAGDESCTSERPKRKKNGSRHGGDGANSENCSSKNVQELSARRVKVMQGLGLMAPSGSPFCKTGVSKITMP